MAGTYYNYAERKADSFVNWAEIGKGISDMLSEENKIREDKKAAIDKASLEFGETLSNSPQGENKDLNEWALEYAAQAQEARLMQDRLLKSGQLSVKDYTMMRQNITDGTTQAFNLVKEYQSEYATKMERYKTEKSQELERWLMAQAEGFGNFKKSSLYINPTDFKVSVALKEKKNIDGKEVYAMSNDPNNFTTVNGLRNRIKGTFDKYDVTTNIGKMVATLGEEKTSLQKIATMYSTGSITETLDITKRSNLPKDAQGIVMKFEEAETKMLQAQLQNPYNTSSILTNTIGTAPNGKQYSFTFSEEEAKKNPNLILVKDSDSGSPIPVFSKEQEKTALERLRLEARMMYDKTVETKVTPQIQLQQTRPLSEAEMAANKAKQDSKNIGQQLAALLTGNQTQREQARGYFESIGTRVDASNPSQLTVYGPKGNPVSFKYGDTRSPEAAAQLIKSVARAISGEGLLYENDIISSATKSVGGRALNTAPIAFSVQQSNTDITPQVSEYTKTKVPASVMTGNSQATAKNLESEFGAMGFAFSPKTKGAIFKDHYIVISAPNGVKSAEISIDDETGAAEIRSFILANQDETISRKSGIFDGKSNKPNQAASGNVQQRIGGY